MRCLTFCFAVLVCLLAALVPVFLPEATGFRPGYEDAPLCNQAKDAEELAEMGDKLDQMEQSLEGVTVEITDDEHASGKISKEKVAAVFEALDEWGFAVLKNALHEDLIEELRDDLLHHVELGNKSSRPQAFIQKSENGVRHHSLLQPWIDQQTSKVLTALGVQARKDTGTASGILLDIVPCGAVITELAAITTMAGAEEQQPHPDVWARPGDSRAITAFFMLQGTNEENGALLIAPGSHKCQHRVLQQLDLQAGSLVLMDSRTGHAGGAHHGAGALDRVVFYFSYAENPEKNAPSGTTYALRPELWGQMRVPLRPAGSSSFTASCNKEPSATYTFWDALMSRTLTCERAELDLYGEWNILAVMNNKDPERVAEIRACQKDETSLIKKVKCMEWREAKFLLDQIRNWMKCQSDLINQGKIWLKDRSGIDLSGSQDVGLEWSLVK
eukprot:TRINITY_DN2048_c0_g1_i8.p1 TRINITY_DN2048_c0_g1~~TRINITY_DN2048_c0_g1_i8.p1  ORF type:complete len:444 (-),score=91.29 TRINITY_DN2048_c0_g1_i8:452-1783(-)